MMAGRKQHGAHRLFAAPAAISDQGYDIEEFEESDVWGCAVEPRRVSELPKPRAKAGDGKRGDRPGGGGRPSSSLPVNIPDWSKILGSHYAGGNSGRNRGWWEEEEEEGSGGGGRGPVIPPHELACQSRTSPFSVHEGVGRTLKGRELSRVRNAIWEKIGFQD
ncbi:protein S40-4-like [Curcuma longa]|uniref:protein S40-4-like n=1 Tax=Curcuma longa TaxID=136217 RepID=UPI003D9F29FC